MILFDIGAHYDIFSLAAAQMGGMAIAVDPSPMAARMIATGAAVLNGCDDRVKVFPAAISDVNGVISMLNSGVSRLVISVCSGQVRSRSNEDPGLVTVDQMVDNYGAGFDTHQDRR